MNARDGTRRTPTRLARHDIVWLRQFALMAAVATLSVGCAAALLYVGTPEPRLLWVAAGMVVLTAALVLVRRWHRGAEVAFVARMTVALYATMVLILPAFPELAPTIAMAALIPVFVAVPWLGPGSLRRASLASWAFSIGYVAVAGWIVTRTGGADMPAVILGVIGTVILMGLVLAIIWRYASADGDVRFMAVHDALTGVSNRDLFMDHLRAGLEGGDGMLTAVAYLDIDRFGSINDRHGHTFGDDVLRSLGDRLRASAPGAIVARVGGDEFAVLLEHIPDRQDAVATAERLRAAISAPGAMPGGTSVTTSIGIAFSGDGSEGPDELLANAEHAMYTSKRGRQGKVVVYQPTLRAEEAERRAVRRALRGVAQRGELRLWFQPMVRLHSGLGDSAVDQPPSGTIACLEALVRWDHPSRGLLTPDAFITLAEETGDIIRIGRWVLEEACQRLADWHWLPGVADLRIAVNLSARQLQRAGFVSECLAIVDAAGIPPWTLELEITEHTLARDLDQTLDTIVNLRGSGIRFAIDDFGTGYSSFAYLRDFPVDTIKLDRSFVASGVRDQRGRRLLRGMVDVASAVGADVVAEGVETAQQLELVRTLGCDLAQGFMLARPMDGQAISGLLRARAPVLG